MLIKTSELKIESDTGFTRDLDIFERKPIGEALSNLFESTEENLIIGLDGQWGEGKSTFSKMLKGHLKSEKNIPSIYFDAFENDYQKDPFLALASEIQEISKNQSPEQNTNLKKSIINASKAIARGALRVGIKTVTAGVLDDTILEELETSDEVGSEISSHLDKVLEEKLNSAKSDKSSLLHFKATLEDHISILGNGGPVVFIIDELDRCRPDFCLELVEQIKHLFTVKNLKFLLVTNKSQLHASIKNRYGSEINAHLYLQKFIDLWIDIPREENQYKSHTNTYLNYIIKSTCKQEEKINNQLSIAILKELFKANKTSYRGIQKTLSYFSILHNSSPKTTYYDYYQATVSLVCYSKAENPQIINKIINKLPYIEIYASLFPGKSAESTSYEVEFTKMIITYLTSPKSKQDEMIKSGEIRTDYGRSIPEDLVLDISNILNFFSKP